MTDLVTNDKQAMTALKQHGGNIVMVIVVLLMAYFGWQYYQKNHAKVDTVAADSYTVISTRNDELILASQTDTGLTEADVVALIGDIDKLVSEHPNTVYAWQALMIKAGHQVDLGDYEQAVATLTRANSVGIDDKGLLAISRLQLARTLLAKGDMGTAFEVVNEVYPDSFEASRLEILGDIHLAGGDTEAAKSAYDTAWELLRGRNENRALLGLKMQALGMTPNPITQTEAVVGFDGQSDGGTAPTTAQANTSDVYHTH